MRSIASLVRGLSRKSTEEHVKATPQQQMPYDHRLKAGNEGDLPKHVALVAALDMLCASHQGRPFFYVDAYAGFFGSRLRRGAEWSRRVGRLNSRTAHRRNRHVARFIDWYFSRPNLTGSIYPGSAMIATDVAALYGLRLRAVLADTYPPALADLRLYCKGVKEGPIQPKSSLRRADLIFLDPPGIESATHPEYPTWQSIRDMVALESNLLLWLPVAGISKGRLADVSLSQCRELRELGCGVTRVVWRLKGFRTVGCLLAYRLPTAAARALRSATSAAIRSLGWRITHFNSLRRKN